MKQTGFDVVVIGGGHAGVEAAAAAARLGAKTALVTMDTARIGTMSCNPAIGGIGKGHLVREVDALDGLMGRAADAAGIQFRVLNRRKGPAVHGLRTQADRKLYRTAIQTLLKAQDNLTIVAGEVRLIDRSSRLTITLTDDSTLAAEAVVLATGTFLGGRIHQGDKSWSAGRLGEAASNSLATWLRANCSVGRLKTGTPPRLHADSIHWDAIDRQEADTAPVPFSFMTDSIVNPQIACGVTRTTLRTHAIIRDNLQESAMFSGAITGNGPRYCPSVEDKVGRFGDRDGHQVFLEPEGLDDPLVYPNGISTSLSPRVQQAFLQTINGLEEVKVAQFGYAIEYDYVDPRALEPSLALTRDPSIFLAGQINGTTGYEEAAAQGLVAGLNAARYAARRSAVTLDRTQSYIGVMIDDLRAHGVTEPYRMFTSRSEFRLSLRPDNADLRLTPLGIALGLVGSAREQRFSSFASDYRTAVAAFQDARASPTILQKHGITANLDGRQRSAFELLSDPTQTLAAIYSIWPGLSVHAPKVTELVRVESLYHSHLGRQASEADRFRSEGSQLIQLGDVRAIPGLSNELRTKIQHVKPRTLRDLKQIEGITPAAIALLLQYCASDAA